MGHPQRLTVWKTQTEDTLNSVYMIVNREALVLLLLCVYIELPHEILVKMERCKYMLGNPLD